MALVFLAGPAAGRRVELAGEMLIGRQGVDLVIEDPEMSRRHARLEPVEGGVRVDDVGSRNGTWVGGQRLTAPVTVAPGTTIRFGDSECRVELSPAPAAAPPVAAAAPAVAPAVPVGAFAPPGAGRRRGAATRLLGPTVVCFAVIALDAVGLLLYFGLR